MRDTAKSETNHFKIALQRSLETNGLTIKDSYVYAEMLEQITHRLDTTMFANEPIDELDGIIIELGIVQDGLKSWKHEIKRHMQRSIA